MKNSGNAKETLYKPLLDSDSPQKEKISSRDRKARKKRKIGAGENKKSASWKKKKIKQSFGVSPP